MTSGPVFSSLIAYSLPIIFSGLLQIFFNAADLAIVGNFAGENATIATAAVGATGSFISLVVNTVMGLSAGVNVILARSIGANDREKTSRIVHTAVTVSLICGIAVGIIGMLLSPFAMRITKCPDESFSRAVTYLMIYFAGCPAIFIYNFGSAVLRTKGDTRRPLNFLIIAGITNVVLNMIFVIFFDMDADGVALATTLSQCLAAFLTVRCLMLQNDDTRFDIKKSRIHKEEFFGIVRYGLPSGLTNAMYSVANIQIQSAINSFGPSAVAGNSAVSSIEGFIMSVYSAMNASAIAFIGQNIGAGNKARIKKVITYCVIISIAASLIMGYAFYFIGEPIYRIYIPKDDEAVRIALLKGEIMLTTYALLAISQMLGAISQAFGYAMSITTISVVGIFGLRTVWMNTVFPFFNNPVGCDAGFQAVIWCYPASWLLIALANGVVFLLAYNRYMKKGLVK
jgi:putative MATE family efflux protein